MIRAAAHPNVRPMLDFFHFWSGLSKFEDLDLLEPGELAHAHFQDLLDGPRELINNDFRIIPGDGIAPVVRILQKLAEKGIHRGLVRRAVPRGVPAGRSVRGRHRDPREVRGRHAGGGGPLDPSGPNPVPPAGCPIAGSWLRVRSPVRTLRVGNDAQKRIDAQRTDARPDRVRRARRGRPRAARASRHPTWSRPQRSRS